MKQDLLIEPRDAAMFRDGRPFSAGLGAKSMGWPMPSTVAGHVRTRLWQPRSFDPPAFSEREKKRLLDVHHTGPFLACENDKGEWELAFAAPADAAVYGTRGALQIIPLRPEKSSQSGRGCDLPAGIRPLLGGRAEKTSKEGPAFWTAAQTLLWLKTTARDTWFRSEADLGYAGLPEQSRIHVQMLKDRRNARDEMLFRTVNREFDFSSRFHGLGKGVGRPRADWGRIRLRAALYAHVEAGEFAWSATGGAGGIGGERRVARWSECKNLLPQAPEGGFADSLLRMQLATPAIFNDGWKPGWAAQGEPPGMAGLKLELVAAAVPGYQAVSGFDMAASGKNRLRATRFAVPAGSVYFFRVIEGDARALWLKSVSDNEQDRRDGFGIVLTGGWQWR